MDSSGSRFQLAAASGDDVEIAVGERRYLGELPLPRLGEDVTV